MRNSRLVFSGTGSETTTTDQLLASVPHPLSWGRVGNPWQGREGLCQTKVNFNSLNKETT